MPIWTAEMDHELRRLAKSHSAAVIADLLSQKFRVPFQRNAVIGRARRKGIAFRSFRQAMAARYPDSAKKPRKPRASSAPRPRGRPRFESERLEISQCKPPTPPRRLAPVGLSKPVPFAGYRDGMCRWPITDVQPISAFRFCGAAVDPGKMAAGNISPNPYCLQHWRMSLQRYSSR